MIIKKEIMEAVEVKEAVICDLCGKKYSLDVMSNDVFEAQEFIHIHHVGGYGSIFGDYMVDEKEATIDVDICQHCFKLHIIDKIKKSVV